MQPDPIPPETIQSLRSLYTLEWRFRLAEIAAWALIVWFFLGWIPSLLATVAGLDGPAVAGWLAWAVAAIAVLSVAGDS